MNNIIYLAADGEVHEGASLHDTLEEAMATEHEYIDEFVDGKYNRTWKRMATDNYKQW